MSAKNVLIISHSDNMLEKLKYVVKQVEGGCEVFTLHEPEAAYICAIKHRIDLFFVDIVINRRTVKDVSGITLVKNIRDIKQYAFTPVVLVSQLEDPALQVYRDFHCYGLVEKPFNMDYIKKLIKDALMFRDSVQSNEKIYFKNNGVIFGIDKEDIVYAESIRHVLHIHTTDGKRHQVRYKTIKEVMDEMANPCMIQCSRNAVVNVKYVENIDIVNSVIGLKKNYGKVDIGFTYKEKVRNFFDGRTKW